MHLVLKAKDAREVLSAVMQLKGGEDLTLGKCQALAQEVIKWLDDAEVHGAETPILERETPLPSPPGRLRRRTKAVGQTIRRAILAVRNLFRGTH